MFLGSRGIAFYYTAIPASMTLAGSDKGRTLLKFSKIKKTLVPNLLHECGCWTLTEEPEDTVEAPEMRLLRATPGCRLNNHRRNETPRKHRENIPYFLSHSKIVILEAGCP
jgi:hypothetical protein